MELTVLASAPRSGLAKSQFLPTLASRRGLGSASPQYGGTGRVLVGKGFVVTGRQERKENSGDLPR